MSSNRESLLNKLYKLHREASLEDNNVNNLEYMYENALLSEGRFEFEEAASIYTNILVSLQSLNSTQESIRLRANSLTRLGSIRRDQGRVIGLNGAFNLYQSALRIWRTIRDKKRIIQVTWYLGACNEMQKKYPEALKYYRDALKIEPIDDELKGAILIRIGTVLTKHNDLDLALKILNEGVNLLENKSEPSYFAYGKQKIAIAYAHKGNIEKALNIVTDSQSQIPSTNKFRIVQTRTLYADLMFRSGEINNAIDALAEAEELANKYKFGHQLSAINSVMEEYLLKKRK
jgi:tetratricopeptide (TPR) repeat protein